VQLRDQAQCTFVDTTGRRCENRRFLHLHHVKPVASGGADEAENLTCLCSEHHSLVHQLSFGIDGQVSWVRAPSRAYS
jgi:predicted restriction endonuclease